MLRYGNCDTRRDPLDDDGPREVAGAVDAVRLLSLHYSYSAVSVR